MTIASDDFPALFGFIAGGLHQDIDLEYDTVPEALAGYARFTERDEKQMLLNEMKSFL
ncbi:hypothetical protein G6L37_11625 [Agrobacterium rubi]|uniref:contact-dependent growth inhibition system immunity protein n=1 Tax=Agrobacterium rubi TaxID=28099 RepID=UPI001573F768|nr:hypothetical protein [Agrobacterium rubi]NTF06811.1 hypothetical protein [Agrobacterium rubi]NTF19053.1 hypothetical protein [Agrobacterium rubi]NTF26016.1 hypothetical protein [Agrobacterium rubi]